MAPPLLHLQNIDLGFGTTPLLAGAELAVSAGDRVCLVGRNGSGKSTLLKHRRRADRSRTPAAASPSPAPPSAICRRSRTSPGSPRRSPMSRPGSGRATIRTAPRYLLEQLGLDRRARRPARCPAARRAAPPWPARWRPSRTSCCSTSRPTISTCRRSSGWRANWRGLRSGLVLISHDRRLLEAPVARAPSGSTAARRAGSTSGFAVVRGLARRGAGAGGARAPQARPQDREEEHWLRYGVTARRKRNQKRLGRPARAAPQRAASNCGAPGTVAHGRQRGGTLRQAGDRGGARGEGVRRRAAGRARLLDPHRCAATGSASSGRTAPARPRCSTC